MPAPPMDPAIVSSQRPNAVYTRAQLLALHASPLVPAKLDGMKDLADWHGDFADPPSPPAQQRHGLPARTSERTERAPARRLHTDASNSSPFANFGRFGVDGGLGDALESGSSRRRARGGLGGAEREADKDVAPHLRASASGRTTGGGEPSSPTKERRGFDLGVERERGDRLKGRVAAGEGGARGGDRELRRRDDVELAAGQSKRDARRGVGPADEGGWRNVGMSREEREKRLIRNQAPPSPHAPAEPGRRDRDRGERGDRDRGERDGPAGRSGRPAWMDDDTAASGSGSPGGSSPAWMDAPASGNLSFDGTGHVRDGEDKAAAARDKLAKSPLSPLSSFGSGAGKNGMDSLQAFKAQMKERERKDRERELRAAGLPIDDERPSSSAAAEPPAPQAAPAKSIFEDLGIARSSQPPPGLGFDGGASAPPGLAAPPAAEGGRGSRFARFFDGKPAGQASPQQQAAQQPPASAFSSLLGAAASASEGPSATGGSSGAGAAGPSKEDSDSMARLLGMLQVSGARSSSPLVGKDAPAPPAPHPAMSPSPLPSQAPSTVASPAPTSASGRATEEGRASSRFHFSNKSTAASPATPAPPAPPGLQSPFLAAPAPPPGFGHASPQQQPAASPAPSLSRSPQQPRPQGGRAPPANGEMSHQGNGPNGLSPQFAPQGPPMPPPGMPPQFYGQRFPPPMPGQLPPGMAPPHFGFAPDGRPLPPPHPGMLPPFASPPLVRANGPLSPPLASPNGISPNGGRPPFFPPGASLPPQMMFGPGGPMAPPPPPPGGMPFPPPPPHHLQGRMPHPPPMFTGGTNPGADLMALLNSGSSGQRIGGDGPPQRPM